MVYYLNPVRAGLDAVSSLGDGYSVNLKWYQAYPSTVTNSIAYHIYYSDVKEDVYSDGVKYVSIDDSLEANIIDLNPGQLYFFSIRPVEYDSTVYDLEAQLPVAYDNLRFYPTSMLRSDITESTLIIPLLDVEGFPGTGILKVGVELLQYLSVDTVNKNLILTNINQRGYDNTNITIHNTDGYDGYTTWSPTISLFAGGESTTFDRIFMCQSIRYIKGITGSAINIGRDIGRF